VTRFLVISGIDGCGKTTLITELRARLEREGLTTRYEWLRYNHRLVRPVHGLSRLLGLSRRYQVAWASRPWIQDHGRDPRATHGQACPERSRRDAHATNEGRCIWRHEFYRSRFFSALYIRLTWLDAWLGRLLLAARLRRKNVDVVVCDRWVPDILVDLAVDTRRRGLLRGTWHSRFSRILPLGTRQYLVVRDADDIVSSRPDVAQDISRSFRQRLYRRLEGSTDVVVVRNDGTVGEAVEAIWGDWNAWACRCSS
jgi:hypothetical protein